VSAPQPSDVLTFASARPGRAPALLVAVALLAFLPGFFNIPPVDRDEPRFAEATRQMLISRDFLDIRFQTAPRYNKPVGIYWLQAAAVSAGEAIGVPQARTTIWLYRLPSLIGALAAVLLTYWAGLPLAGRRGALIGGLAMAVAILTGVEARLATTDAVLLATVLAMQGALARIYLDQRTGRDSGLGMAMLFWAALGLGALVKGPLTPMIALLTVIPLAALNRNVRWLKRLRPLPGIALAIVIVAPWLVAIGIASHGAFFKASLGTDMLAKVGGARESHGAPPLTYLLALWGLFWPASALVPLAIPPTWRARAVPAVRFLLAWLLPSWIVFELVPTKLPHYILPLLPALALLFGRWLAEAELRLPPLWGRIAGTLLFVVGAVVLPAALFVAIHRIEGFYPLHMIPFAVIAWAFLALATAALWRGEVRHSFVLSLIVALATYGAVYRIGLAELRSLWVSPRLAAAVNLVPCPDPKLASAGDHEPSLVFLTSPTIELTSGAGAAQFLAKGGCRIAFVGTREQRAFEAALPAGAPAPVLITKLRGINLNGGHRLDIGVFAVYPGARQGEPRNADRRG
jgi:4-amino-4-deoxy-L-arabinose transferase-like glycosyltransferase